MTASPIEPVPHLRGIAESYQGRLRDEAAAIERERRVPKALADELASAGFYRMLTPKSLGGGEVHPRVFVESLIALGRGDGATAWTVMTGSTTGLLAAYLPREGAAALFGDGASIPAGVFAPLGRATPVPGGYRLSGRWPFTSGVENSAVRLGGGMVFEEGVDGPRLLSNGQPEIRSFFLRAEDTRIEDTWKTSGLRGTGSHDMVVEDVFVPNEHTACVFSDAPKEGGVLYRFPLFGLLSLGVSAVGLGIARAALDAIREVAVRKKRGRRSLAETELAQLRYASAEGELRAAKALMLSTLDEAYASAQRSERGEGLSAETRASLRLAATHAAKAAASVTDAAYHLGGGASIYDSNPLQRHFRDVHTMTQHIMVNEVSIKPVGRILFGLPTDVSQL
ncbi:MAG: acyl-CoA dehydrogenase family protein [Myxococcota bacterium]